MAEASRQLESAQPAPGAELALGKTVAKTHLVNRLNYLNFQDQPVLVNLRHIIYDSSIFLRAKPLPCAGERLDCVWAEVPGLTELLKTYRVDYILIPEGKKCLLVNGEVTRIDEEGLSCVLPLTGHEFQARKIRRHPGADVSVQLIQYGAAINGELVDYTPEAIRMTGKALPPASFQWINTEAPLNLRLFKGGGIVYSGAYEVMSQTMTDNSRTLVLRHALGNIRRFREKRYRNARQQLIPSPNIVFDHPLIGKRINLKIADLSGSGFSVEESEGESVLMPGMMIPNLRILFAQGLSIKCLAQVLSRNPVPGPGVERSVRCGVAILDMDIRDHVKLLSMLHQVANRKSYVGTEVDMDDLWDFFFETGFIYPGKYLRFQANKEDIKRTYARLYGDNPQIARHFIYQDRGKILGHMAMVRFFHNSWMVHHHAARKSVTIKAGLAVLDQVTHYLNELGNFSFAHLNYVYCYYRPDNKFPNRVFGGFARQYPDPRACSLDSFAFWHFQGAEAGELEPPWELVPSTPFDLSELASFYRQVSGGLLIDAFDLEPGSPDPELLAVEYRTLGFKKERYCYSLRKEGGLKAFLLVNCTDAGFNMADLTNCVTLIVLDEELPPELAQAALKVAARHYEGGEMPVLGYPLGYLERHGLPYDKSYVLWILNLQYSSDWYLEYCEGLFRSVKRSQEV